MLWSLLSPPRPSLKASTGAKSESSIAFCAKLCPGADQSGARMEKDSPRPELSSTPSCLCQLLARLVIFICFILCAPSKGVGTQRTLLGCERSLVSRLGHVLMVTSVADTCAPSYPLACPVSSMSTVMESGLHTTSIPPQVSDHASKFTPKTHVLLEPLVWVAWNHEE